MKTLLLLRHGQARDESANGDRGRVLTKRGQREARASGRQIHDMVGRPDHILASDAQRARQTAQIVAEVVGKGASVQEEASLYLADTETLVQIVHALPDAADCALLVGHNPGLSELGYQFAEPGTGPAGLPTGGLVCFAFEVASWSQVRVGTGQVGLVYALPKRSEV